MLSQFIRIPNLSPDFDPDWTRNGYFEEAVELLCEWCDRQRIDGAAVDVIRLPGRVPLLLVEIRGDTEETVLFYGHYDKQPGLSGWHAGLGPWSPVVRSGKLFGRGGADDGYALVAALVAIRALREQAVIHPRCIVLIEGSEESSSVDLPDYLAALHTRIGIPELIISLDAECGDYDRLWCTTSLRGHLTAVLKVTVLDNAVHSGSATGIVPSSFSIVCDILSQLQDFTTGEPKLDFMQVPVPEVRKRQAETAGRLLGEDVYRRFPWAVKSARPTSPPGVLILANTWTPSISVTGVDGLPSIGDAGSLLLPSTAVKLSIRLPPTCDSGIVSDLLAEFVSQCQSPDFRLDFAVLSSMNGWHAGTEDPTLERCINDVSSLYFGAPAMHMGTGGNIPFVDMMASRYPDADMLVTGLLGPGSNAHGPNESLDIDAAKRLTSCLAQILYDRFGQ